MLTNTQDFLDVGLGILTAGARKLHVLLATYNNVAGYKSGLVETDKEGLAIQVQNGNLFYSPLTFLIHLPDSRLARVGAEMMDHEAREAQSALEANLVIEDQEGVEFLAVVYAGLSAFHEAVELAHKLKEDRPSAKVVVVTCDCDLTNKTRELTPMLKRKELDAVVVTHECGGRATMRNIMEKVVSDSPVPIRVPV